MKRFFCGIAMSALVAGVLAGCQGGESTRLRGSDFEVTTQAMAQSLGQSAFLAERTPQSPPAYIVIDKVVNLTGDLIPESEQWMLMARVQGSLPLLQLVHQKNIHFLIPPERQTMIRDAGYTGELLTGPTPTHALMATFRAAQRTATNDERYVKERADYYYLEYQLADIKTREIVWTDKFEFKREAKGLAID